jgi:hypothetical protein
MYFRGQGSETRGQELDVYRRDTSLLTVRQEVVKSRSRLILQIEAI